MKRALNVFVGFLILGSLAVPASAQFLSLGVKAGVPLTDFFETVEATQERRFLTPRPNYLIGPTAELHLPARFSIELDALNRRIEYTLQNPVTGASFRATGSSWEFPLLVKYRASGGLLRPYVASGVSFSTLTGLREAREFVTTPPEGVTLAEQERRGNTGFVIGGGLELRVPFLRISPEIRHTRWGWRSLRDVGGLLRSRQDQTDFILGITF
jgi:hypothetical protein